MGVLFQPLCFMGSNVESYLLVARGYLSFTAAKRLR